MNYEQKYLKYKAKYIQTKQEGGLGGKLHVYFLSKKELEELKVKDDVNVIYPGLGIHKKKNDSGFAKIYPHIVENKNILYVPITTKVKKLFSKQKVDKKVVEKLKILTNKNFDDFDYYEKSDVDKALAVLESQGGISDIEHILLIRDYGVIHDVFIGILNIEKTGGKVSRLAPSEIPDPTA